MENRSHAIIAACFLVVLCLATVLIIYWLSSGPGEPMVYRIVTSESVSGLQPQASVQFKGMAVGHVSRVRFDPKNPAQVIIDLHVRRGTYITHATYAVLTKQGLMGGEMVELKLGKGSDKPLATSATDPAQIPLHQGFLASLKSAASKDMADLSAILGSTKKLLDANNRQHISHSIRQIDVATAKLVAIEKQLAPVMQKMPTLVKNANQSLKQSQALLASANQLAQQAQKPVKKIGAAADSVQQLTHKLDTQTAPDVGALSRSLVRTSRELQQLIGELKAKPQSLIFGPAKHPPGPGEPGFHATDHPKGGDHGQD